MSPRTNPQISRSIIFSQRTDYKLNMATCEKYAGVRGSTWRLSHSSNEARNGFTISGTRREAVASCILQLIA